MGFRSNSYATVWDVETVSDTVTKGRISTSYKNKNTGEYQTDFSRYVSFIGSAAAKKAAELKPKDRIKLGDVDVTSEYDKNKKVEYINCKIFSFDVVSDNVQQTTKATEVDSGEVADSDLPF